MPTPLFEWKAVDVMNAIIAGSVIAVLVGGPLSIYLAFVVNRLAAFRQIKLSALTELAVLAEPLYTADTCLKAQIVIRALLEIPPIAMQQERQMEAAIELLRLRKKLREHFLNEFDVEMSKRGLADYSLLAGNEWVRAFNEVHTRSRLVLKGAVKQIEDLQPNLTNILMFKFLHLGWVLRRSDCADCCENCNRTI